ncbi:Uncharacterised protein [Mycobacterium tuberculosis]|uniref:Uncharacterized protein n=2 Tax=Mycobacterium tuberculosis TaxID=1773 RepID=A0A655FZK8_MYCTX|nr:Uncharacterised protein [Mycobacterium tuberculosis]CKT65974.1 Uncharacterised protein [Mycobacterium tuberculosis]CKU51552.1 Uncharacterised protein [Mycobacterium tuberculosis]CNV93614.1 Uncharacterised protein [Mycobacterium tuberculosis]CNW25621.1 Uncharacterised protein [Mycobacterium tuberculosis]
MSSAAGPDSTSVASVMARGKFPEFIANVAASASRVLRAVGSVTRLRVVCRNAVARSGSLSIQNRFAARGIAQAISSVSVNSAGFTAASTASASRPRPCQPSA